MQRAMKPKIIEIDGKKYIVLEDGVTLKDYKEAIINNTLQENENKVVESAKKLGIGKTTIYRIKEQGGKGLLNG